MVSKTRKNRGRMGGSNVSECEKTYCKKFLEYATKFSDLYLNKLENLPKDIKNETTTKLIKVLKTKKYKDTLIKTAKKNCKINFCNIGCKNTLFESSKDLPKDMIKKYKDSPELLKLMMNAKKDLFGNKTSVLKDNFYEKLSAKDIKQLQSEGAISGCVKSMPLTK
jgi:hypothetical protein